MKHMMNLSHRNVLYNETADGIPCESDNVIAPSTGIKL